GDEFAVILKESDKVNAIRVAERIRDAFNRRFATYRVPITASLGIANFPQDASQKDEFIVAADKALYESKKHGRDRVTAAPSMTDAGSLLAGADDRKTSKMSAKNKTKALTPQQLEEMKKSYFSSLNAKSTNISPLINKENSFRGQRDSDMRFHVPDAPSAPSEMNINRKSIKTQIFNPEASPLTQK
ncbi:GGDEF domain-containing protein, partial [bacterium]|nr:GGDEF domain-containing protein [bacterium]